MNKSPIVFGLCAVITLVLMLAGATPAFAVSTVSISPAGDGVFALQGIGIEDASAMEINVTYDTSTLANPRVVEGPFIAGAMPAFNPNVPGIVRIVVIRIAPMKGSGLIATLTFTRTGSSAGRILSLSAKLANVNGSPLTAQVQVINPTTGPSESSPSSQTQSASSGVGTAGTTVIVAPPGVITGPTAPSEVVKSSQETPGSTDQEVRTPPQKTAPETANNEPVLARTAETGPVRAPKTYSLKSVLDLFREFKGPRTADAFIALFDQESMIGCKQSPAVVISDGKSVVTVSVITPPGILNSSDITVAGAKLLSLSKDSDNTNTWIVKLLPQKGVYQASLTVTRGDLSIMYPLIVAPKADIKRDRAGTVTKAVFDRYFKKISSAASPAPDLNGDGKWDYWDDYILTANYLDAIRAVKR